LVVLEFPIFGLTVPGGGNFCAWGALDPATDRVFGATATYKDANGLDLTVNGTAIDGFPADTFCFAFSLVGPLAPGTNEEVRVEVQALVLEDPPILVTPGVTFKIALRGGRAPAGPVPPGP
jgi:hypothetical protein